MEEFEEEIDIEIPEKSDLSIIKDLIRDLNLDVEKYSDLISVIRESDQFMDKLQDKLENLNKQLKDLECYRDNYLMMADSIDGIHNKCFRIGGKCE